jgi:protein-tyrosine phosphatase
MPKPSSVLFVCLGNICRSPMADAIARHRYPQVTVDSAGTGAYHVGETADPRTLEVLRRHGIPYDGRARQVRASDFEDFDLILAMDASNRKNLLRIAPTAHAHKVRMVLEPLEVGREVSDPYYGGPKGFDIAFEELDEAIGHWLG